MEEQNDISREDYALKKETRLRKVTMEETQSFLKIRKDASVKMALGVAACVFSPIPLILLGGMARGGMIKGAYEQVLQVGDYTQEGKEDTRVIGRIASVYWCVVTAAYVGYSLWSKQWAVSWVIWPVAGILFGAIASFIKMRRR